jgi:serine/threonine protein kinase
VQQSLRIINQASDGLAYAHSQGVIHSNISPQAITITEAGTVKIAEFESSIAPFSQKHGIFVGALNCMAPELLRGNPGSKQTDIYSLAAVLYEMISGSPPCQGNSEYDQLQAILNDPPQPLYPGVRGLEKKTDVALRKALAKDPMKRFGSISALSKAIGIR